MFNVLMGLRRSEINGLKYSDVDYINRTLKVERQLGRVHNADMEIIFVVLHMADQEAKDFTGSIIKNFLLKMGCLTFVGIISVLRIVHFF